jgi:hypothetical protein
MRRAVTLLASGGLLACAGRAHPVAESPVPAAMAEARQSLPVDSGSRVRVVRTRGRPREVTGALVARRTDSLVLVVDRRARQQVVAVAEVRTLEVSRGTHRHVLRSAGQGLVGAAGIGAFFGVVGAGVYCLFDSISHTGCSMDRGDFREVVVTGAALGGTLGVGLGALYGYLDREDTWEPVSLDHRPAGGALLGRIGVGVSLGLPPLGR